MKAFWGSTLYHRDDLPSKTIPATYAAFREMVKGVKVRGAIDAPRRAKGLPLGCNIEAGSIPTLEELGIKESQSRPRTLPVGGGSLIGGEVEALRQMEAFLKELKESHKKRSAGNGPSWSGAGANFSCQISPWLALGCLSPRHLYHKVSASGRRQQRRGREEGGGPDSSSWLHFELMWRDFFRFVTSKHSAARSPSTTRATQCPSSC